MNGRTNGFGVMPHLYVVASSLANLPSVVAEETLGLITSITVTGILFSNDKPAGRPTGEVRVKTGTNSNYTVSNVCKNKLSSLNPVSVFQYNGSAWVLIEAYIRKSALWKRIRSELYNAGTAYNIGTMTGYAYNGSTTYSIGTYNFSVGTTTSTPYSTFACVYGSTAIDVTNIDTIKFSYARIWADQTGTHKATLYTNTSVLTGTNAGFSEGTASVNLPVTAGNTVSLDVSALTGNQYIHVAIGRSTYATVDTIYGTLIIGE